MLAALAAHTVNTLLVGRFHELPLPKSGGWLLLHDDVPQVRNAKIFDPLVDSFNPLSGLDYRKACDIVDIFDSLFDRGNSTLTKDTGLDFIAEALEAKPKSLEELIPRPDKKSSTGHVWAYGKVRRILRSPVLKRVLCNPSHIDFAPLANPKAKVAARINRKELGDFDALALGLFLLAHSKGQVVVPDFGFYGRECHTRLIREERLIAGVRHLDDVPEKLRRELLSIKDTRASGAWYEDAKLLALHAGLVPQTNIYNDAVARAMA